MSLLLGLLALSPIAQAAVSGSAKASSYKVDEDDKKLKYDASKAVDGSFALGWAEDESGYGEGSWLELDLGRTQEIKELNIWPGNLSEGKKSYREYSRPKKLKITLSGGGEDIELEATFVDQIQRYDLVLEAPVQARKVHIEVVEVYEGFVFSDLYIAEVAVNFRHSRDQMEPLLKWLDTPQAQAEWDKHDAAIKEAFQTYMDADFGDQESLEFIMSQAGDGADFIRNKVPRLVDVGYRAAAVKPDEMAIDALRKLKDANAIPAIEMAQLRSYGSTRAEFEELVEIFYAYQDLVGGPSLNVPYWGETGWSPGQIQSFGEPIPIEVTPEGDLLLADIGNNRVQRFSYEGRMDKQWGGGQADLTNAWFDEGREWYVSGQAAGERNGAFINPLDVELVPMGEGMGFAVLDASKRVQIYDDQGRPYIGWTVQDSSSQLDGGVGGEGYLAWVPRKKRLYVIVGNEMVAYNLEAEELGRWELEDGTPNAVEVGKNNKLYMAFGREVIKYDLDGFRHGVVWDETQLGEGFEDLDLTLDEDKRMWVVTDQGWAHKFKNERKIEYSVQFSDVSLIKPRIAVQDEILYCVDRDRVIRLDALQAKIDAEEAAKEAAEAEAAAE
ncbi:MAG: hypothetical protein VX899_13140 [Myxococcota bacterium]|nr:hypothetical protein [Myxococcota bacterium]